MPSSAASLSVTTAWVDHNDWVVSALGTDFFGAIPEEVCEEEVSYRAEELGGEFVFAIETRFCSYLTVEQPARLGIEAGDTIKVRLYHAPLTGPPEALAHVGLAIGGEVLWSRQVPIPAGNAFVIEEIVIDSDAPAGTPILFHVDNHGDNEYALIELTLNI